jgi:hypothetical protein
VVTRSHNTFTPNGDGINDVWNIPFLNDYPRSTLNIFKRNGKLRTILWDMQNHGMGPSIANPFLWHVLLCYRSKKQNENYERVCNCRALIILFSYSFLQNRQYDSSQNGYITGQRLFIIFKVYDIIIGAEWQWFAFIITVPRRTVTNG